MEVIGDLWQTLIADYPAGGIALGVLLALGLVVWGIRGSAY